MIIFVNVAERQALINFNNVTAVIPTTDGCYIYFNNGEKLSTNESIEEIYDKIQAILNRKMHWSIISE